jgi:glycosyltransferase involved in cell wall biosynthesis
VSRLALLIPARNAQAVLGRLLDAADAQTVPFDEILVWDDASTDRTGDLAAARGARVIRSDVNTGPSFGKNMLAQETTCEWVHFLDADDALAPEFVARAHAWIDRGQTDVVVFGTEDRDDETGAFLGRRAWDDAALQAEAVRYNILNCITNCGVYERRRFLQAGGFDLDNAVKYNEDQAMHLRLALAGLRFRADDYTGVTVYRRRRSMSADHPVECARAQCDVLVKAAERTGRLYAEPIGARLWRLAGVSAGYSDWTYVRACLALARRLGYRQPREEHPLVRLLARVNPLLAVAVREWSIRTFKPRLRAGMPSAAGVHVRPVARIRPPAQVTR